MHKDQIFTYTKYTQHFVFILFIFYMVVSNDFKCVYWANDICTQWNCI